MNSDAVESIDIRHIAPPNMVHLGMRPITDTDRDFLCALFVGTRAAEFAHSGLPPTHIDTLLAEQFAMQDAYYRRHYPDAHFDIVTCRAGDIGRLYHHWGAAEVRVIDIALMPSYRGNGVGTRLMQALVAAAARQGLAVSLYVETTNPVRALYQRLGFVAVGENGVYELMRRDTKPFDHGMSGQDPDADLSLCFGAASARS